MSKEAMKLALDALEYAQYSDEFGIERGDNAMTALREALANEALDKMAENARELGLDYEPAQQEPGRNHYEDGDVFERIGAMKKQPSQQEPVAWGWAIMHSDGTYAYIRPRIADFFGSIQERDSYTSEDAKLADREWAGLAPHTIVTLYTSPPAQPQEEPVAWKHDCAALLTNDVELWIDHCPHCGKPRTSPPAQRTWVGLTDEEVDDLSREMVKGKKSVNWLSYSIEAKLKEKNT